MSMIATNQNKILSILYIVSFSLVYQIPVEAKLVTLSVAGRQMNQTDKLGFRWDLNNYGNVNDGTSDLFDGGVQLQINNQNYNGNRQPMWDDVTNEFVMTDVQMHNLTVSRRVMIDLKNGYGRWTEVLRNNSNNTISVSVKIYSNLGNSAQTFSGIQPGSIPTIRNKYNYVVVGQHTNSSRPHMGWLLYGQQDYRGLRFTGTLNNDNIYADYGTIRIPARSTVSIVHFIIQRRNVDDNVRQIKKLNRSDFIRTISAPLRKTVINFRSTYYDIVDLKVTQSSRHDELKSKKGDLLRGKMKPSNMFVETVIGEVKVPFEELVAIQRVDKKLQVITIRGERLIGAVHPSAIGFHTDFGDFSIPLSKLEYYVKKKSNKKTKISTYYPAVTFTDGSRIRGEFSGKRMMLESRYGSIKVASDKINAVIFEKDRKPVFILHDGSRITARLLESDIPLTFGDKKPMQISIENIRAVWTRPYLGRKVPLKGHARMENHDVLVGNLTEPLEVDGVFGIVEIVADDIRSILSSEEHEDQVNINLKKGSSVVGSIINDRIPYNMGIGGKVILRPHWIQNISIASRGPVAKTGESIKSLIDGLGSNAESERIDSYEMLLEIGSAAVPLLKEGLKDIKNHKKRILCRKLLNKFKKESK